MQDTPQHIRNLQLQLWLAKTPEQRLLQFITENDAWLKALKDAKSKHRSTETRKHAERHQQIENPK